MKKTSLLVALAISTGALFGQSQRLVFVEEYTQASCGPCASANPSFNTLLSANTTKAVSVKYQVSWPGVDPMNAQNPTEVATRVSYYAVSGVPDAYMDGNVYAGGSPSGITQSSINSEYAVASPFAINLTHWFNTANDSIFVNCEVTASQATALTTGKLHIVMVEKTITFSSPPGSNGEKDFYNVFRKAYPSANGTALAATWTVGQKKTVSFKAKIPSYIYQKPQIAMVAWIQDDSNKNTKQAAFSPTASPSSAQAPVADFTADALTSCDGIIKFSDQSALFPTSWSWDFGDNTTSALQNPSHQYFANGNYTVKLTATNANGNNQAVKTSYIAVALTGAAPSGTNDNICLSGVANLSASGSGGTLNWYNASGVMVNTGNTYSPNCVGTTNFYVSEATPNSVAGAGPANNSIGAGAQFTANNAHGLYFDVAKSCVLQSVDVYAGAAGNRTIDVIDANGTTVQTAVKNLPAGQSTVSLNFPLSVGTGYFIKVSSATVDLYRNSAGAVYPYSSSVVTITGNDANPLYYYFFYNWKVQQNPCMSPAKVVSALDSCSTGVADLAIENSLSVFPNPSNGAFTVSFNATNSDNYTVKISNTLGRIVYTEALNNFSGAYSKQMDIASFGKGMYMLSISDSKNNAVRKAIVQ